jgi:hypothetical protein
MYLKNEHGRTAWAHQVIAMLGLDPKKDLPDAGVKPQTIQGIVIWVEPRVPGQFKIRVRACCPVCGREMSAGRLQQHSKIHR